MEWTEAGSDFKRWPRWLLVPAALTLSVGIAVLAGGLGFGGMRLQEYRSQDDRGLLRAQSQVLHVLQPLESLREAREPRSGTSVFVSGEAPTTLAAAVRDQLRHAGLLYPSSQDPDPLSIPVATGPRYDVQIDIEATPAGSRLRVFSYIED